MSDEIPRVAQAMAGVALGDGQNEWLEAKDIDMADLMEQAVAYADAAEKLDPASGVAPGVVLFLTAFQFGYMIAEGRTLQPIANPLLDTMRKIADAPLGTMPNDFRKMARHCLLSAGLDTPRGGNDGEPE